jgi:hypothetical protein
MQGSEFWINGQLGHSHNMFKMVFLTTSSPKLKKYQIFEVLEQI